MNEVSQVKISKVWSVVGWFWGVIFIICALGYLIMGAYATSFFSIVAALVVLPPVRMAMYKKNGKQLHGALRFVAVFVLMTIGGLFVPDEINKKLEEQSQSQAESESNSENNVSNEEAKLLSEQFKSEVKAYDKNKDITLADVNKKVGNDTKEMAIGFAAKNNIGEDFHDSFYRCLGDFVRTKDSSLQVDKVMGWCLDSYNADPAKFKEDQARYSYFDLKGQFSSWDGAHSETEKRIKEAMNNPKSYEHVETGYRIIDGKDGFYMLVNTKFRGTNAYGAVMTNSITAKVNPENGQVLEMDVKQ